MGLILIEYIVIYSIKIKVYLLPSWLNLEQEPNKNLNFKFNFFLFEIVVFLKSNEIIIQLTTCYFLILVLDEENRLQIIFNRLYLQLTK